jgi:DNA-binding CsgD family transcriptional regulator/PAS domain-containing protein
MGTGQGGPDIEDVFARLYEAATLPEFWPDALQAFSDIMGSRGTLLTRVDRNHQDLIHSPDITDSVGAFFEGGWQTRDLRTKGALQRGALNGFTSEQHIITPDDMRRSAYYRDFARPADVPWFATGGILSPDAALGLSLQRTARQDAFSTGEIGKLDAMLPRLQHVLSIAYRLATTLERALIEDLGGFGDAVILLGDGGAELDCNAAAERLFGDGLVRGLSGPGASDPFTHQRLRLLIEAACGSSPCPTQVVDIPRRGGPPLRARASPVAGRAKDIFGRGRAFLIVSRSGAARAGDAADLCARFGLTPAEGRVASLLVSGKNTQQIAAALQVSPGAVRFHIKAILPKAQTHRRAEFVAKAGGSVVGTG